MNRLQSVQRQITPNDFKYTTDRGCLTTQQRRFYQQNGYLVIKNFLKDQDIKSWTTRFVEYCDRKIKPNGAMQVIRDITLAKQKDIKGEAAITKLQNLELDQVLFTFCKNESMIPYLKSFCGDNIKSVHTMFINKPPFMGSSSRHPFHQDLAYFPFRPANRIVAAWASLEDSNKQNGSLNIFPGTHKGEFLQHIYPEWDGKVNKAYFGIANYEIIKEKKIDLQMKKGDIVFFHPLLIHGSGQNKSKGYRKSFCCHFADASCRYIDIKGTFHQKVSEQIMEYATKKYSQFMGEIPQYTDIWKFKSTLISGVEDSQGL